VFILKPQTMHDVFDRILVVNDCSGNNIAANVFDYTSKQKSIQAIIKNNACSAKKESPAVIKER
jgi:hypothetical protein